MSMWRRSAERGAPRVRVVHVRGSVAIPVENHVEVVVYALDGQPQLFDPWIRDLGTGVVYARTWHYGSGSDVARLPLEPRDDLPVVEQLRGQVRSVRILPGLLPDESGALRAITTLVIAVEE